MSHVFTQACLLVKYSTVTIETRSTGATNESAKKNVATS